MSNIKQITLAMMMYASDYDGCFPTQQIRGLTWADSHWTTGYFDGNWNCAWPNWISGCLPYIKNTQILSCPTGPLKSDGSVYSTNGSSYSYNGWVAGHDRCVAYPAGGYIGWGRTQTEMNAPAQTIILRDYNPAGGGTGYWARMYPAYQSTWNPPWYGADPNCDACAPNLHNEGGNYGFCDGHANGPPRRIG